MLSTLYRVHIDNEFDLPLSVLSFHTLNRIPEPTCEEVGISSLHQEPAVMLPSKPFSQRRDRS